MGRSTSNAQSSLSRGRYVLCGDAASKVNLTFILFNSFLNCPTTICENMKKTFYFLIVINLTVCGCIQKNDETQAIKAVIENETNTWRAGDIKGHAACWYVQPYTRILVSTADGLTLDISPNVIINPTPDIMGDKSVSVNTNYKISVNGNSAWSSHDQETTATDGTKSYSYEMRMLEKINGQWKIVGESVHHYKPK